MKKKPIIKYTDRDFESSYQSLIQYASKYYGNNFSDFAGNGPGSLFLKSASYISDVLSFYLDYETNENFLEYAVDLDNIIKKGRMYGNKYNPTFTSQGFCEFYIEIPESSAFSLGPEESLIPILKRGTEVSSNSGSTFILTDDLDFNSPSSEVVVSKQKDNGSPLAYVIKAYGKVISGLVEQENIEINDFIPFRKIPLASSDVAEILDVIDSEGNRYYEVDNLSQDVVYKVKRSSQNSSENILKPVVVPRRFTFEYTDGVPFIVMGASSSVEISTDELIDPAKVFINEFGRDYISSSTFDPSKLVESDMFGIGPSNTTITIRYRISEPSSLNASQNSVVNIKRPIVEFRDNTLVTAQQRQQIIDSLEVDNEQNITGEIVDVSTETVKRQIYGSYNTQGRAVNALDYASLCYVMPTRLGSIKRAVAIRDTRSLENNINLYVVSDDANGNLTRTGQIQKNNLKNWILSRKSLRDVVDILDAYIINFGIDFKIVAEADISKYEALENAYRELREFYLQVPEIGESFSISEVYSVINRARGVLDVVSVKIRQKKGGEYSDTFFNVEKNTSSDGREIKLPRNVIWEIKYVDADITGEVL